jgi:uroporphyrinogen III methyltransferase/synthase
VAEPVEPERLARALDADYVTFTASSTVRSFVAMVVEAGAELPPRGRVVSIGPITSATATDAGLTVHAEAAPHDIPGLMVALLADAS